MQDYSVNLVIQTILSVSRLLFDIGIMWFLVYYVLKIIKNNTRTIQIFKGILVIIIVDAIAKLFGFTTVSSFASMFINWGFLGIIIIFQPEIRALLERLGKSNAFSRINVLLSNEKEKLVREIYDSIVLLSENQVGAIISIEQSQSMQEFIKTGIRLNSDVSTELLTSIFMTTTPLHDGAVIIQGNKIACAAAFFPPTSTELPSRYGSRHRAAYGISEISDCLTIVVSEETSTISIAEKGKLVIVDKVQLRDYLKRVICDEEIELNALRQRSRILMDDIPEMMISKENQEKELKQRLDYRTRDIKLPKNNRKKKLEQLESEEVILIEDNTEVKLGDNNE